MTYWEEFKKQRNWQEEIMKTRRNERINEIKLSTKGRDDEEDAL